MSNASVSRRLRSQVRSHARFPRLAQLARDNGRACVLSLWSEGVDTGASAVPARETPLARYQRAIDRFVLETRSLRTAVSLHQLVPDGPPDEDGTLPVVGAREDFDAASRDPLLARFLTHATAAFRAPVTALRHRA